jgi:hypothetical protein
MKNSIKLFLHRNIVSLSAPIAYKTSTYNGFDRSHIVLANKSVVSFSKHYILCLNIENKLYVGILA